jgi:hypothetical protein
VLAGSYQLSGSTLTLTAEGQTITLSRDTSPPDPSIVVTLGCFNIVADGTAFVPSPLAPVNQ